VDFTLTADQRAYQQVLRDFVQQEIKPVAREWEQAGRYPTEIVEQMKAMGLFGLLVPEEYGGVAADFVSFALTFEEISRGWMGVAGILGSHSIACWLIARYGTEGQRKLYLPDLATGARRSGIALTEPQAGTDLQGISTRARRDGDHYVVSGSKMWITNARYANPLPTLVKTDPTASPAHKGMSVLLIDSDLPGFSVSRDIPKLGYKGTESCEVVLDDVRVPVGSLLGEEEGRGLQQVLSGLETGRINVAARALGVAQASYDAAFEYSQQRIAFGQPISQFQAIQLKLADMATEGQAARLLTYWAAAKLDTGERADLESSMAKLFASEVGLRTSLEALRIHGGYGYSTEYEVERYYRDAPLMAIGEGTSDILRTVIARQLLAQGT
jgi:alkylation response protein AidB-like acyl-CoA dehydrogenase